MLVATFGPAAVPAQTGAPQRPAPFQAASTVLLSPRVAVAWAVDSGQGPQARAVWSGESVVGPPGTLELGPYGQVRVAGMTPAQAEAAIQRHMAAYVMNPHVRLTVKGLGIPVVRGQSASDCRVVTASGQEGSDGAPELSDPLPQAAPPAPVTPAVVPHAGIGAPTPLSPEAVVEPAPLPVGPPPAPPAPPAPMPTVVPPPVVTEEPLAPAPAPEIAPLPAEPVITPAPAQATTEWRSPERAAEVAPKAGSSGWRPVVRLESPQRATVTRTGYAPLPTGTPGPDQPPAGSSSEEIRTAPRPVTSGVVMVDPNGIPVDGMGMHGVPFHPPAVPRECAIKSLPPYVVEPPDILLIQVTPTLKDQPIQGQHLVRPDGTINLGIYGEVYVNHMTLDEVRMAVYTKLTTTRIKPDALKPENINVDVLAYNSKFYYVITDGGGYGEQVVRFPITGKETVLDAISQIQGLPPVASKCRVWVARPGCAPYNNGKEQILPVDWIGVTQCARSGSNFQLVPGDRVYVDSQKIIRFDTALGKFISPIERVLGVTLLGATTVNAFKNGGNSNNNNNR